MTTNQKDTNTSDQYLEMARKQASDYAMALDLLSTIARLYTENETIGKILELFTVLFSPQQLFYISLRDNQPEQVYSTSTLPEDSQAIKNRVANFAEAYAWTESETGFLVTITYRGNPVGIIEADELAFPEYKDHYLNLALSIIDVCGLAIENARKHQRIKDSEQKIRNEKEKLEKALAKVKKLSGLLPICSYCKKIRDDKGYWNEIDTYIQENSEAELSHGICQQCADEYYPDLGIYDDDDDQV